LGVAIFDGPTKTKISYGVAQPVKVADYSSDEGDYFRGFVEGSVIMPSRFELGNATNTQRARGDARRTRSLNRCSTVSMGFEPILLKDVQHSFSTQECWFRFGASF
jgi:hypothetical protein